MNWRIFAAAAISVFLVLGFASAFSQTATGSSSGFASVSLSHSYAITPYGFGVLNDSFTFVNNGNSSVQIPTLHVGFPSKIASRLSDTALSPPGEFNLLQSQSNGSTILTITPDQPTLAAGANSTVAVKGILDNILNYSAAGFNETAPALILLSPSVDANLTQMTSSIVLPTGGFFVQTPSGFTAPKLNATAPTFTMTQKGVEPQASAAYLNFNESSTTAFTPIKVTGLVRTIVPTANGSPVVDDTFSIENLASYTIASIHLYPVNTGVRTVTLIPSTLPPLVNPQVISLATGVFTFSSTSLAGPVYANSNESLEISYPLPSSMMTVTGSSVKLAIPTAPVIDAPVTNYTISLAPVKGIVASGTTSYTNQAYSPFTPTTVSFTYSVSVGWAADQAIPAAALVFALAFALFAIQRPASEKEEEDRVVRSTSDVLKAFDAKTGLETQYMAELAAAPKGSINKNAFDRMRDEVADLRGRALQRLNEMKQELGSGKQYDLLIKVTEAEKEEDRAFRDLLNLYVQYHGSRMNDETFKRLQPNYRKRVESAVNRLSDLLHEVQMEEK